MNFELEDITHGLFMQKTNVIKDTDPNHSCIEGEGEQC